jgi:transposase
VVERVPHGHWKTLTLLAALRLTGLNAPVVVDGPINGDLFRAWTVQHLLPTLHPGDIVIMDNLTSHKVKGVREAIESAGARVLYLPPYSPDFNPIEQVFAWFKAHLRKWKRRTVTGLENTIADLCAELHPRAIANGFEHCGYRTDAA